MSICISNIVISHPKNATICEGREVMFTCVLNMTITDLNVKWYRLRKDHFMISTVEIIPNNLINYTIVNEKTTLIIRDAPMTLTGFYWIKASNFKVCNVSLNVLKGMCDNEVLLLHIHNYIQEYII